MRVVGVGLAGVGVFVLSLVPEALDGYLSDGRALVLLLVASGFGLATLVVAARFIAAPATVKPIAQGVLLAVAIAFSFAVAGNLLWYLLGGRDRQFLSLALSCSTFALLTWQLWRQRRHPHDRDA